MGASSRGSSIFRSSPLKLQTGRKSHSEISPRIFKEPLSKSSIKVNVYAKSFKSWSNRKTQYDARFRSLSSMENRARCNKMAS